VFFLLPVAVDCLQDTSQCAPVIVLSEVWHAEPLFYASAHGRSACIS
jgi:hypothetical protein